MISPCRWPRKLSGKPSLGPPALNRPCFFCALKSEQGLGSSTCRLPATAWQLSFLLRSPTARAPHPRIAYSIKRREGLIPPFVTFGDLFTINPLHPDPRRNLSPGMANRFPLVTAGVTGGCPRDLPICLRGLTCREGRVVAGRYLGAGEESEAQRD